MNKLGTDSYYPSYIVSQRPNRFGGQQEDYLVRSRQIIHETAEKIIRCRESGGDLKKLFFEIIAELSRHRAQIAKDHRTNDAEHFGKRRDEFFPGRTSTVVLRKPYEEYGNKLLDLFSKYLGKMDLKGDGQFQKEYEVEETYNGKLSRLHFEVLDVKDLLGKKYVTPLKDYLPRYVPTQDELMSMKDEDWTEEKILEVREKFRKFKAENPEGYRLRRINLALYIVDVHHPSPSAYKIAPALVREKFSKDEANTILGNMKSLRVRAVLRTEIGGKLNALTEYYTWMYETGAWLEDKLPSEHPINRMKQCSKVLILHQDEYSIQPTLEDIAKIFESAVSWNKQTQTLDELKDTMALLFHRATHNIRDLRGTAAANEWLQGAIFDSLKVENEVDKDKMLDLEAFTHPFLSDFAQVYHQMTQLKFAD
jgi:hypothetical protein